MKPIWIAFWRRWWLMPLTVHLWCVTWWARATPVARPAVDWKAHARIGLPGTLATLGIVWGWLMWGV
ncbi:hypothetical protein [Rhodoferax sp. PAMC 29310]|uniref:hypothetical protein n=1 Tax=Rhodoferax sp. PAMC 29310 TaxID=2822760 RepID=UPI001B331389|nr:hypothetical protein [Rhodoferax sp. PAMC 29310]